MLILGWITVNPHAVPAYIHPDGMSADKALFVLTPLEKESIATKTVGEAYIIVFSEKKDDMW